MPRFIHFIKNQKGATAIEYALLAAMIAVAIVGTVALAGDSLNSAFERVSNAFN